MTKEELKPIDVSKYTVTEGGNVIKDKLKQEVEDWWNNTFKVFYLTHNQLDKMCSDLLEPREKQIQIDAEQIRALQKQNGELTDKVNDLEDKLANADYQLEGRDNEIRELKAQIEKMKCCFNCKHSRTVYEHCRTDKREKWERKEK